MSTFTINRLCSDLQTANCTSCHAKTCCCDNVDPLRNPAYVNLPAKAAKLLGPTKASFKSPTAERGAQASGAVVDEKHRPTTAGSILQKPSHPNEHSVSRSVHWLTPPSTPRNGDNAKETRAQLPAINGFSGFPADGDGALTARATPGAAAPAVTHVREGELSRRRELYMDSSTVSTPATTAVVNSAGASGAAAPPASSRRGRTWEAAPRPRTGDGDATGPAASHARTDSVFTGDPAVLTMFKGKTVELHPAGADVTIQPQPSAANFLN